MQFLDIYRSSWNTWNKLVWNGGEYHKHQIYDSDFDLEELQGHA